DAAVGQRERAIGSKTFTVFRLAHPGDGRWCEIARRSAPEIELIEVRPLVAVAIPREEEMLAVALPDEVGEVAPGLARDRAGVPLAEGTQPDVANIVPRCDVRETPAIR